MTSPAAGMMDCKKALEESEGDFDKAVEILRIKGAKDVGKRAGRTAANGLVAHSGHRAARAQLRDRLRGQERRLHRAGPDAGRVRRTRPSRPIVEALLAATLDGRPHGGRDGRGGLRQDRREAGRQPLRRAGRRGRRLHAPQEPRPAAAGRRGGAVHRQVGRGRRVGRAGASRCRSRPCGRSTSPATRCPADVVADGAAHRRGDRPRGGQAGGGARAGSSTAGSTRFYKDFVLVEQASVTDQKKTVKQVLADAGIEVTPFRPVRGWPGLTP